MYCIVAYTDWLLPVVALLISSLSSAYSDLVFPRVNLAPPLLVCHICKRVTLLRGLTLDFDIVACNFNSRYGAIIIYQGVRRPLTL